MTHQYALLKGSEDGNPLSFLDSSALTKLLLRPADWGVERFAELDGLPDDPNCWPDGVAVLLRVEVVVPVPAGMFKLPDAPSPSAPPPMGGWVKFPVGPITMGDVTG